MAQESPVFKEIYEEYLKKVADIDFTDKAEKLGIHVHGKNIEVIFFNKKFTITPEEITDQNGDKPHHAVCVVLCKYLLICPDRAGEDNDLVTYKNFKDAAPYVGAFKNTAEKPIARHFSGKLETLEKCCFALGGNLYNTEVSCQLSCEFQALPKVPIYLFFNDEDEEFPAECLLLFKRSAKQYLDMECIAMTGNVLAEWIAG